MQLYSFFNSSTSYRVRIALALKDVSFDVVPVNIRKLEHREAQYVDRNPCASVPLLVDDGFALSQSMAIIDYLDEHYPDPRLIPASGTVRARVLELSNAIACDMHPVNNLRILNYLQNVLRIDAAQKSDWYKHWVNEGMQTVETLLRRGGSGKYCFGDQPTLADCCLVPQIANAQRMGCDMSAFTHSLAVYEHCLEQPAFRAAEPASQPDYQA